jgi:hypothetical protein
MESKDKDIKIKNNVFLSHHDMNNPDFLKHVFIIKGYAVCIGCIAEALAAIFIVVIYLFFSFIFKTILNYKTIWIILIILSVLPNYFIYLFRFFKKAEFPNKYIRFLSRFLLTSGFFLIIIGIFQKFYIIEGILIIGILGIIFFLLRKFSGDFLLKIYDNQKFDMNE